VSSTNETSKIFRRVHISNSIPLKLCEILIYHHYKWQKLLAKDLASVPPPKKKIQISVKNMATPSDLTEK